MVETKDRRKTFAGESSAVDHLVFIVHGIGSACDMKFRNIAEVVDGFRELAGDMSERHFQSAHLSGEFLFQLFFHRCIIVVDNLRRGTHILHKWMTDLLFYWVQPKSKSVYACSINKASENRRPVVGTSDAPYEVSANSITSE